MSDDEANVNSLAHQRLLQAVTNLRKSQHIGKPTRNEPRVEPDEFGLVKPKTVEKSAKKSSASGAQVVKVNDIVQVLKGSEKHTKTKNLLSNVRKSKKVLERPLEKPAAQRIKRILGYTNVKKNLKRWNAVVAKNRSSEAQVFPLPAAETVFVNTSAFAKPLERSVKSDLQQQFMESEAKLQRLRSERAGLPEVNKEEEAKLEAQMVQQQLTREELMAKRKELAYMRMRQSQLQAKARLQKKVKSKKYHKLLKRQKLKEQMKEFELLQKTNPEAAMEKLNAMERNRIYERASLRHKNTGTWAKNLQMRAKYDQSVRRDLAEQLQISRELTQKKNVEEDAEDEEDEGAAAAAADNGTLEDIGDTEVDPFNPWTRIKSHNNKEQTQPSEDDKSWRKYWLERNQNEQLRKQYEADKVEVEAEKVEESKKVYEKGWLVEQLTDEPVAAPKDIDSIFDEQEERVQLRLQKRLKKLEQQAEKLKALDKKHNKKKLRQTKAQVSAELKELKQLELKSQAKQKPLLDEELNADSLNKPKTQLDLIEKPAEKPTENQVDTIDVTKVANVRLQQGVRLENDEIDVDFNEMDEELEEDREQQINISEAFEDDDIVADFSAEKKENAELKNVELDLGMPGWGSWAGAGISQEAIAARRAKGKQRRLVLHLAAQKKRLDNKKPNVLINETVAKDLREHLVSDVPFPFTRVKDFEASVRAPLGRTFVPETAFRMLIRPEVRVRKGQVIQPMDEAELVKPAPRLRHEVDKRIAVAQQEKEKKKANK